MKKPMSDKTLEIRDFIEFVMFGTKRAIEEHKCPSCKQLIGEFRNAISRREYEISGLCQKCQDGVFGADNGD